MTCSLRPPLFPLLSVDPSSTFIGCALVGVGPRYLGSWTLIVPSAPPDERVLLVGPLFSEFLGQFRPLPAQVLIEIPDYIDKDRVDATKIIPYFRAVGAVEASVAASNVPVVHIHASRMKQLHRKQHNKDLFQRVAGRPPVTDDESDALAQAWEYVVQAQTSCSPAPPAPPL